MHQRICVLPKAFDLHYLRYKLIQTQVVQHLKMAMVSRLKALLFAVLLFVTSFFGGMVFGGCLLPLFFFRPGLYRYLFYYLIGSWLWLAAVRISFNDVATKPPRRSRSLGATRPSRMNE
jgi:hypothetical protein